MRLISGKCISNKIANFKHTSVANHAVDEICCDKFARQNRVTGSLMLGAVTVVITSTLAHIATATGINTGIAYKCALPPNQRWWLWHTDSVTIQTTTMNKVLSFDSKVQCQSTGFAAATGRTNNNTARTNRYLQLVKDINHANHVSAVVKCSVHAYVD